MALQPGPAETAVADGDLAGQAHLGPLDVTGSDKLISPRATHADTKHDKRSIEMDLKKVIGALGSSGIDGGLAGGLVLLLVCDAVNGKHSDSRCMRFGVLSVCCHGRSLWF